jgi:hypothetical protein
MTDYGTRCRLRLEQLLHLFSEYFNLTGAPHFAAFTT